MAIIEFTFSEKEIYEDKQRQARELVAKAQAAVTAAQAEARNMIGVWLGKICESHEQEPPANAELLKNKQGKVIGLAWGEDYKKFLNGELTVRDAVVPPKPTGPAANLPGTRDQRIAAKRQKKLEERNARQAAASASKNGGSTPVTAAAPKQENAEKKPKVKLLDKAKSSDKVVAVKDDPADATAPGGAKT